MEANMTKIMLVEDDKSLREIYGIRLMAEGYEIKSAGDGEEALAMAIKERPDLIISDVMMPKISGFDMLDILRATPETKDIKIIMMTALSSEDQRARGEALGANRYLVKSQVGIEDVVRTVHDVLADTPAAAAPTPAQLFGAPIPTSTTTESAPESKPVETPEPSPIIAPTPAEEPTPTTESMPMPPTAEPEPITTPIPPTPVSEPAFAPTPNQNSMMPQPTAPFSSPAPATLGERVISPMPTQPVAPAPVVNISQPFSLPPQPGPITPTPMAAPEPVITAPTINTAPMPAPTYAPAPVVAAPTPFQDVIMPQPSLNPVPDISAMIAQELNDGASSADIPHNPAQ